jgi:hypothetical protein
MKRCTKCGMEKDESEFYKDSRNNNNPRSWCKKCEGTLCRLLWRKHHPNPSNRGRVPKVCKIIRKHHEEMKDDPNHLTTDFIQKMVGRNCNGQQQNME